MKPGIPIIIFFFFSSLITNGQGQFNNWFFGQQAGISFNSANATPILGSSMAVSEGSASVSDAAGNLLFYTDGTKIWNRLHAVMLNGSNIMGDPSTTQGCLVVPMPGNPSKYYLFTLTDQVNAGDLRYSIIDMNLDGGKGGVVVGSKNILITTELTEKMVSARASACGVWVITHSRDDISFEARLITSSGIQIPVYSAIGSMHSSWAGTMKVSKDDSKIAVAVINGTVELFDFNNSTGVISNAINLPVTANRSTYSACFSADSKKLYVAEGAASGVIDIYQFDLSSSTPASIIASKTLVSSSQAQLPFVDIQLGPDNKLYLSKIGMNCLGVIPSPNLKAPLCGYLDNGICLGGKTSNLCLPNDIRIQDKTLEVNLGPDAVLCPNSNFVLAAPPASPGILWSTGATSPSITVSTGGTYWLELDNGICRARDSIKVQFTGNIVNLGDDTAICAANSLLINPGNFISFQWQDNSNASTFTATTPGLYWVEVTDLCGVTSRDSIVVTEKIYTIPGYPDRVRCNPDTVVLRGPENFLSYSWSPNYNINGLSGAAVIVTPATDTTYFLKAEKIAGCFAYDTIQVRVRDPRPVHIGGDTAVCAGEVLKIDAGNSFSAYQWSNGALTPYIETAVRNLYWVQATDQNGCKSRDSLKMEWKNCETALWIPDAFTPNDDGKNDRLNIRYKGYFLQFEFNVYNRWGQLVYSSKNPQLAWDGNYKGEKLTTDTFIWSCTYQLYGESKKTAKGTITLIR